VSYVTDTVLVIGLLEAKGKAIQSFLEGFTALDMHDGQTLERLPDVVGKEWYGGHKRLQAVIYVGAIDHLDVEGTQGLLDSVPWDNPADVLVVGHGEDTLWLLRPGRSPENSARWTVPAVTITEAQKAMAERAIKRHQA